MTKTSRYPKFHKYVTRAYLIIICILAISLPTSYLIKKQPTLKEIVGIIVGVLIFYVIYWLIVRLNCYGTPLQERTPTSNNNNSNNNNNHNSTSSSRSSSNGGGSNSNNHPTFANYRLAGLSERLRRFGSNQSNNSSSTNEEDDLEEALRPPPPTYNTALEGAGLPPPYMNDFIEINVHNSESNGGSNGNASLPQMSERVPPRRPVPSVPSSSSLRRPVPPIPPQPQSTLQDNSSPTMIDSSPRRPVPQTPRRPVPSIPTSSSTTSLSSDNKPQQPRRAVPSVPASSSSSSSSSSSRLS